MSPEIIIAVALVSLLIAAFILAYARGGASRPNILIAGTCDSGKTLLFSQLTQGAYKQTHTSLKENQGTVEVKNKNVVIIDIPGHERLRQQFIEKYASTAKAIVYVIDSSTVTKDIKDVAEYLYMLLTDPEIMRSKAKVLLACNKQDLSFTKSCKVIQSLLEKEITTVRKTRSGGLAGTDGSMTQRSQLGSADADFEFSQLGSGRVQVRECSARGNAAAGDQPDIEEVSEWLQSLK